MSIPFSINLKRDAKKNEILFLSTMEQLLGEQYKIYKTVDDHESVDFKIIKNGDLLSYMELKVRKSVGGFNTLKIGKYKLQKIRQTFRKCVIAWYCIFTNTIYHTVFKDDFMKCLRDEEVYYIPKDECLMGIDTLVQRIGTLE